MNHVLNSTIIGSLVGVLGTGVGGILSLFVKNPGKKGMSSLLSLASGIMCATVVFHLLPEAFGGKPLYGVSGIISGVLLIIGFEFLLKPKEKTGSLGNLALLVGISIATHNLPEGLAVGGELHISLAKGFTLAMVIAFHDLPEGFAMALPMRMDGKKPLVIVLLCMLAGVPTGIGAGLGNAIGSISEEFAGYCVGFAAGAMLMVVMGDMLPEAKKLEAKSIPLWFALGFLLGGAICLSTMFIEI